MVLGGGAGLLGNCWLVVAATTDVLIVTPTSVITMTGLEGIPVPISLPRVWLALVVVKTAALFAQSRAAYPESIWMA
jgi:hypothetical protein